MKENVEQDQAGYHRQFGTQHTSLDRKYIWTEEGWMEGFSEEDEDLNQKPVGTGRLC